MPGLLEQGPDAGGLAPAAAAFGAGGCFFQRHCLQYLKVFVSSNPGMPGFLETSEAVDHVHPAVEGDLLALALEELLEQLLLVLFETLLSYLRRFLFSLGDVLCILVV